MKQFEIINATLPIKILMLNFSIYTTLFSRIFALSLADIIYATTGKALVAIFFNRSSYL